MKFYETAYLCRIVREKIEAGKKPMPDEVTTVEYLLANFGEGPDVHESYQKKAYDDIRWVQGKFVWAADSRITIGAALDKWADVCLIRKLEAEAKAILKPDIQRLAEEVDNNIAFDIPFGEPTDAEALEERRERMPELLEDRADGYAEYPHLLELLPKLKELCIG